jgi:anti-sigma factor ChrR (cupin superfamily)
MAAQQLNYADSETVRASRVMQDRCARAVAKYALYLLGNQAATAEQKSWARGAMDSIPSLAERTSRHLLNQDAFLDVGSGIEDAVLSGIIETAINNHFIPVI